MFFFDKINSFGVNVASQYEQKSPPQNLSLPIKSSQQDEAFPVSRRASGEIRKNWWPVSWKGHSKFLHAG
jgi:hypothetical protein